MKRLSIITLVIITFSHCKHKEVVYQPIQIACTLSKNFDTIKATIQGTWQWLEEKRVNRIAQRFDYLTPQNQGYSLVLKINNDTAKFYKNNYSDSVYTYKVVPLREISGTNFPEDNDPVLVFYNLHNGLRDSHVPIKVCDSYLLLQYQFVNSIIGEYIWKKQ